MLASQDGHMEVVNMLFQHGARVDLQKEVHVCNLYSSTIIFMVRYPIH